MTTERQKEPVQIENPFTCNEVSFKYWQAIRNQIVNPKDEIESKIVHLANKILSGQYSVRTDFHIQRYFGWRHFNRINEIIPPTEQRYDGRLTLTDFVLMDDPFEQIDDPILGKAIEEAGKLRRESWSIDDQIHISTRDLGNPHSFADECARLIWNNHTGRWYGVGYRKVHDNKSSVGLDYWMTTRDPLNDHDLARHIRVRWLLTDPGELIDPVHTPPERLDEILREYAEVQKSTIIDRLKDNRIRFYEGNPHYKKTDGKSKYEPPEFSSRFFGIREEPVY